MTDRLSCAGFFVRAAAWTFCVVALLCLSDRTAMRSDAQEALASPPPGATAGPAVPEFQHRRRMLTEEQWAEAAQFLAQYSPKRLALIEQLPDGPPKQRLRNLIYNRYLTIRRIEENFPKLHEVQLERLRIEDNLFDLHRQFVAAAGENRSALRIEMKQQLETLFENTQKDRDTRIERLLAWVKELQAEKDADDHDRDAVVARELQEVITVGPNALFRQASRREKDASRQRPMSGPTSEQFTPATQPAGTH